VSRGARRGAILAAVVLALAALDVALVEGWYRPRLRRFADRAGWADTTRPAVHDAAVVFFGALDGDRLDADTRHRVEAAAALYRRGRVREVIAVGGARPGRAPVGARVMARELVALGVPAGVVSHDSGSFDSLSNWEQAQRIADARGLDSLVLVSAPTHLMRLAAVVAGTSRVVAFHPGPLGPGGARAAWGVAHRETLALAALSVLPRGWYVSILRRARGGQP